jgi:hypothetical protein
MNNKLYIPDISNMTRPQRMKWAMSNLELAEYVGYRKDMLGYLALKGHFVSEESNRDVLFTIFMEADKAFNFFVDYLENAHPLESDEERTAMLANNAYPTELMHEAFQNVNDTFFARRGETGNLSATSLGFTFTSDNEPYDPLWWVYRFIDFYLKSCSEGSGKPFDN